MKPRELRENVYWVGAIDWDRRLFDELIPLPDGTSYNAYLVKGRDKTALIDTVDPSMADVLIDHLRQLDVKKLDYVIVNHAEQDHSGTLCRILELYPEVSLVATPKCKDLIVNLHLIPEEKILAIEDGATLSLGDKTLQFTFAPWVHWPDTMLTFLKEDGILFSCDLFGSHLATSDLYVSDEATVYEAAKRYYAEIMMPFAKLIQRHLQKVNGLHVDLIAPSHGPLHDKPEFIVEAYSEWVLAPPQNVVVLPYISMHGSTKKMVDYFVGALIERGVTVKQFNLSSTDVGKLAMALVDAATIIIGTPTILVGPHPNVVYAAYLANVLRPKAKFASIIGSYGWGGRMVERITQILSDLKIELLKPVVAKGFPRKEDFQALDQLADEVVNKHKEHNLFK